MSNEKNVLFVVIDQLRADCLHGTLSKCVDLPRLNALKSDAVTFNRHYSVTNPCGPSRASILTGLYAMNHRSVRNATPLRSDLLNLATEARKAGYEPMLFGYSDTSADPRGVHPADPALKTYERPMSGFCEKIEMTLEQSYPWRAHLKRRGYKIPDYLKFYVPVSPGERKPTPNDPAFYEADDSDTAFLTDEFLKEMSVRTEESWFAHLTYIRPHPPLVAPVPYNAMYRSEDIPFPVRMRSAEIQAALHPFLAADLKRDAINEFVDGCEKLDNEDRADVQALRSVYLGLATEVDAHVGRVVDFLKDTGQYGNTLLVVTADHGEMLGDFHQWGKMTFFDAAYHTPLIVRDPSCPETHGATVDEFTESIDLAPTILEWIGRRPPIGMNGSSLLPFLEGQRPRKWRDGVYSELDFGEPDTPTAWQIGTGLDLRSANLAIIREQRFKLVHFNGGLPPLLFDMESSEGEMRNIADDPAHSKTLLRLTRKLLDHRMRHADHALSDMKITPSGVVNFSP